MTPFPKPEGRRAMLRVWCAVLVLAILLDIVVPCVPKAYMPTLALVDLALFVAGIAAVVLVSYAAIERDGGAHDRR